MDDLAFSTVGSLRSQNLAPTVINDYIWLTYSKNSADNELFFKFWSISHFNKPQKIDKFFWNRLFLNLNALKRLRNWFAKYQCLSYNVIINNWRIRKMLAEKKNYIHCRSYDLFSRPDSNWRALIIAII